MMRRWIALTILAMATVSRCGAGQETKLWTVSRYDEMERGTTDGVAIRNDGRLEPGPAASLLTATGGNYVWALASDGAGNAYAGLGGTAASSAVVLRVAGDGKTAKIFEGKELAVQAVKVAPDGSVLAATSPDGKVYRVPIAGGAAAVVFDPATTAEKPKYLWDLAVGKTGEVYVATGAPAALYRVPAGGGKAELLFRTADQHLRCLLLGPDGTLWAGSDGAGVIYRFATAKNAGPEARPFAVYAAPKREITALAMDAAGNVYAAGVGGRGGTPLPPLPISGNVSVSVTYVLPASSNALNPNTLVPEGSEIYRIGTDGAPSKLLTLKDDVVYGLAWRGGASGQGTLLAASGNRGRVYRVDLGEAGQFADVAHLEAAQGMAFAPLADGLLVATSNSGKVYRLGDGPKAESTYTSEVFDATGFSLWGRVETRGASAKGFDLYLRSGNVESPVLGWSEWVKVGSEGRGLPAAAVPSGRFVQWKALLRPGGGVNSVGLNYLPRNLAPVVDEVLVATGARVIAPGVIPNTTVQVAFPVAAPAVAAGGLTAGADAGASTPLTAQKDRTAITVRWLAHDDNGDELIFAVWYRGDGETNWRLLKDKITERFYSFDSALLPDGMYTVKVVASDAPAHGEVEALSAEKASGSFVIDTTPPVVGPLEAKTEAGKIHARFEARDAVSAIARAEYSVDAGPWQYVAPVGRVSDAQSERYDFYAPVPVVQPGLPGAPGPVDAREHVIAVRVYDRFENVSSGKAVVR